MLKGTGGLSVIFIVPCNTAKGIFHSDFNSPVLHGSEVYRPLHPHDSDTQVLQNIAVRVCHTITQDWFQDATKTSALCV
jgi:hypothetical protein